jgi:hypothetical protein
MSARYVVAQVFEYAGPVSGLGAYYADLRRACAERGRVAPRRYQVLPRAQAAGRHELVAFVGVEDADIELYAGLPADFEDELGIPGEPGIYTLAYDAGRSRDVRPVEPEAVEAARAAARRARRG